MPEDSNVPRYPAQITVYCDGCGSEETGDYVVSDADIAEVRFGYARKHLREKKEWQCDVNGDFCPACKTSPRYFKVGDVVRNKNSRDIFVVTENEEWSPRYYEAVKTGDGKVYRFVNGEKGES